MFALSLLFIKNSILSGETSFHFDFQSSSAKQILDVVSCVFLTAEETLCSTTCGSEEERKCPKGKRHNS